MTLLTDDEIASGLTRLTGWAREGNVIHKTFTFAGFAEAVAFVGRLVPGADAADHHPDLAINYRHVTVTYTTHSAGGLTARDLAGARMADEQAGRV